MKNPFKNASNKWSEKDQARTSRNLGLEERLSRMSLCISTERVSLSWGGRMVASLQGEATMEERK